MTHVNKDGGHMVVEEKIKEIRENKNEAGHTLSASTQLEACDILTCGGVLPCVRASFSPVSTLALLNLIELEIG